MKLKITFLFSFFIGILNAQNWEDIGASAPFNNITTNDQSLTILDNGTPVVAFIKSTSPNIIQIVKWDDAFWQNLPSVTVTGPQAGELSLIHEGNTIYLGAAQDVGVGYDVYQFDGINWLSLDDGSLSGLNFSSGTTKLSISDQPNDLVLTFSSFGGQGDLPHAYKYDGLSWDVNYGTDLNNLFMVDPNTGLETNNFSSNIFHNGPNTYYLSVQSDPGGGASISNGNQTKAFGLNELRLYKYDAGNWSILPFLANDYIENDPTYQFAIDGNQAGGFPTLAYVGNTNPSIVNFQRMDGAGNYNSLPSFDPGFGINALDMVLDNAELPFVAVVDNGMSNQNKVIHYNGTAWDQIGAAFEPIAIVGGVEIDVFNVSNKVYVLYSTDSGSRMKVYNNQPTAQTYTVTNTCQDAGLSTVVSGLTFEDLDNDSVWVVSATSSDINVLLDANIVLTRTTPYDFNSSLNQFDLSITSEIGKNGPVDITITYSDGLIPNTEIVSFNVNGLPTVNAGADLSVCEGEQPTLTGSGTANSYTWDNGVTDGVAFTASTAGTYVYTCTGTDINGCMNTDNMTLTVNQLPNFATSITNISCNGNADGQINIAGLTAGTSYTVEYTYLSSPNFDSQTADLSGNISVLNLPSGNYTDIKVTNNVTGCISATDAGPYTITEPTAISNINGGNQTVCEGDQVTLAGNASGGTPIYDYSWDNGVIDNIAFTPIIGTTTYTLTITDANGCIFTDPVNVTVNPTPLFSFGSSTNPTACGATDGQITFVGLNPTTNYDFIHDKNGVTQSLQSLTPDGSGSLIINNLDAASYNNFQVINTFGCIGLYANAIVLSDPGAPTVGAGIDQTVCEGTQVTLVASNPGGATITWDNGVTDGVPFNASVVGTTTYTVTADLAGCIATDQVDIIVNPLDDAGFTYSTNAFCLNESNPTPTINSGGGTFSNTIVTGGPFSVNNSTGIINLLASSSGTVDITYNTIGTCPNSSTQTITLNAIPTLSSPTPTTICLNSGELDLNGSVTPIGGVYSGNYIGNNTFNPLNAGVGNSFLYNYSYTDINGCTASTSSTIDVLDIPIIGLTITNTSCGNNNGSVISNVTGGATPYTYYWSNGTSGPEIANIGANTYYLNITDANSCYVMAVGTIQSSDITVFGTVTDNLCHNLSNGAIDLTVTGSTGPYTYYWSNGETTEDISNLLAGEYEVFVTDANGCMSTMSFNVGEPTEITSSISTQNTTTCGANDGSLTATIFGGSSPYTFDWVDNNSGSSISTLSSATNLGGGAYTLNVTDINGCNITTHGQVSEDGGPTIVLSQVTSASCTNDGAIDVMVSSTNTIQSTEWSNGQTTEDISGLSPNYYTLTVTDVNGCTGNFGAEVEPVYPNPIEICIVTVDTTTNTNLVVWEKPVSTEIDYFIIYRETSVAGEFLPVDTVLYSELSQFTDPVAYPQLRSWRYKISVVNNCGIESIKSPAHKTIHVTISQIIAGTYVVNWDNYEGFVFTTGFDVYRFTNANGWELISNTTDFTITDTPPSTEGIDYMISVTPPSVCTSTGKAIDHNASRSNTTASITSPPGSNGTDGIQETSLESIVEVYPNPSSGEFSIDLNMDVNQTYEVNIYDVKGSIVQSININSTLFTVNLKDFENGMYILEIKSENTLIRKQLIKK